LEGYLALFAAAIFCDSAGHDAGENLLRRRLQSAGGGDPSIVAVDPAAPNAAEDRVPSAPEARNLQPCMNLLKQFERRSP